MDTKSLRFCGMWNRFAPPHKCGTFHRNFTESHCTYLHPHQSVSIDSMSALITIQCIMTTFFNSLPSAHIWMRVALWNCENSFRLRILIISFVVLFPNGRPQTDDKYGKRTNQGRQWKWQGATSQLSFKKSRCRWTNKKYPKSMYILQFPSSLVYGRSVSTTNPISK